MTGDGTTIRRLEPADVDEAEELSYAALAEVGERFGADMGTRDAGRIATARARVRHIADTDPDGSFVAERDGRLTGIALAIRRGPLWFLSLLAVRLGEQGQGTGRDLLDAALAYAPDCDRAMITASPDPKALRRYGRAGFALHAGYEASGRPDRAELPAGLRVRDGDWDRDIDLVEELITAKRGVPYGSDLDWEREQGAQLHVIDDPADERAFALTRRGGVQLLAATSPVAASRVLWAALAEAPDDITVNYLLGGQQWAIEVALAARLPLALVDTLCTRGRMTPPACYLPSGLFG